MSMPKHLDPLKKKDWYARIQAVRALARFADDNAVRLALLRSLAPYVAADPVIERVLAQHAGDPELPDDDDYDVRYAIVRALAPVADFKQSLWSAHVARHGWSRLGEDGLIAAVQELIGMLARRSSFGLPTAEVSASVDKCRDGAISDGTERERQRNEGGK